MASPPPPPPPPPPGRGLAGALTPTKLRTSSPLLTPSALTQSLNNAMVAGGSGSSAPPATAPPSPLSGVFINQHVPLVLSLTPPNYSQWRTLFEVMFRKCGVVGHITGPPRLDDPIWMQDDAHVVSWLYTRISPEIFGLIHQRDATAAEVWRAISTLFLENREHQAVFLATDFRRLEQGSSSVMAYFAQLKEIADHLADLDEPVDDRAQVLNMFRGLHPRLHYAIPILTMQTPFPTFLRCRAFLLLEESRLNMQTGADTSETALHAARQQHGGHGSSGHGSGSAPSTNYGGGSNSSGNNGRRNNGKNKGKAKVHEGAGPSNSGGGSSSYTRPPPAPAPAPSAPPTHPWTGMVHAWPMPWRPHAPGAGILGSGPGAPNAFAGTATHYGAGPSTLAPSGMAPYGSPSGSSAPPPAPQWDQAGLIQALNAMNVQQQQQQQPPPGTGWYLDTGASSHMASSSGSKDEDGHPPM